jgi:hypothetical protein
LRKYLIMALAAVLSIAVAAVAVAQTAGPTLTASVSPTKAGTKKKPKTAMFKLQAKTNRTDATVSSIVVSLPKTVRMSGKGWPTCALATVARDPSSCPSGSKIKPVGGASHVGISHAVYGPGHTPTQFTVDLYVSGTNRFAFYVTGLVSGPLDAKLTGGKGAQKLTISVPDNLQQPGPGLYAGLIDLETTLKDKRGKNSLITTTGCSKRKHKVGVTFKFTPNSQYPATGSTSASDTTPCKK